MNFQTVSTAQKLPTSDGLPGGYTADGTPGPLLQRALDYINAQVGSRCTASTRDGLAGTHDDHPVGQARPVADQPGSAAPRRRRPIIDGAQRGLDRGAPGRAPLVTFSVDDDGMLFWLSDRSAAARELREELPAHPHRAGEHVNDPKGVYSTTVAHSGLTSVVHGDRGRRAVRRAGGDSTPRTWSASPSTASSTPAA